jgi:hypothetical protein
MALSGGHGTKCWVRDLRPRASGQVRKDNYPAIRSANLCVEPLSARNNRRLVTSGPLAAVNEEPRTQFICPKSSPSSRNLYKRYANLSCAEIELTVEIQAARGEITTAEEIVSCLRKIRKSVDRWNRQGGKQGYLQFIEDYVE